MSPLRLVFLGSDAIALPLLDWFAGEGASLARLAGVFTQPDRPTGRGFKVVPNAIARWAEVHGVPVFRPERLDAGALRQLQDLQADLGLVFSFGHILRDAFIAVPRLGMLNLHASLLPKYRGASPIQAAIASGDRITGISLMRIVRELDAGPVAEAESVPIGARDTAAEVEARLAAACVPLLARSLPPLSAATLQFAPQDAARATWCRKLTKTDGYLDFSAASPVLAARINALNPRPGCSAEVSGQAVKFGLADVAPDGGTHHVLRETGSAPGTVLGSDGEGLLVAAGTGVLRVLRLQRAGGKMLPAPEFLRGFGIPPGSVIPSRPMPALISPVPFPRRAAQPADGKSGG